MYDFLLQIIFLSSLGAIIFILASAIPRVSAVEENKTREVIENLINKIPLDKLDATLNNILEKFLRRLRVVILKLDHWVTSFLGKVKDKKADEKERSELFERKK